MKKTLIIIVFSVLSLYAKAQNLVISELASLLKSDVSQINDYLISKNWEFQEFKKVTDSTRYSVSTWNLKGSKIDNDMAVAWLSTKSKADTTYGINYQFSSKELYLSTLQYLKKINARTASPVAHSTYILKTFFGKKYVYMIYTFSSRDQSSKYGIEVMEYERYVQEAIDALVDSK